MARLILATGTNEGYYRNPGKASVYLATVDKHSSLENWVVCLDFLPTAEEQGRFPNLHHTHLDSATLRLPLNHYCVQHGEFTPAIPGAASDVILYTDCDIRLQRDFNLGEVEAMLGLKTDDVIVGYNAGPEDTLLAEAARLSPQLSETELRRRFTDQFETVPLCYNVGAIVARRDTWERLCDLYVTHFGMVDGVFRHVARQQWFISWILAAKGFNVQLMPPSFHTHGHYRFPTGIEKRADGLLYYQDQLVLLAHAIR